MLMDVVMKEARSGLPRELLYVDDLALLPRKSKRRTSLEWRLRASLIGFKQFLFLLVEQSLKHVRRFDLLLRVLITRWLSVA